MRYTYIHDGFGGSHKKIDSHHIVIEKGRAWIFLMHIFLSLFASTAFYHILVRVVGFLPQSLSPPLTIVCPWSCTLVYNQGNFFTAIFCGIIMSAFFLKSVHRKLVVKESVVIFPAFGVQLETHHKSGRVFRRFIPIDKILKPVLNEHVTPFTCYWSLALMVRGKEELILVFKEAKLPVKMLIPVWRALCVATSIEEAMNIED